MMTACLSHVKKLLSDDNWKVSMSLFEKDTRLGRSRIIGYPIIRIFLIISDKLSDGEFSGNFFRRIYPTENSPSFFPG
ncbi:unnamed protein product [Caenorhabditis nigoni]